MPFSQSQRHSLLLRRQKAAELVLRGWTQMAIAEELGITQPTVCADLKRVREAWLKSSVRNFDLAREEELRRLDLVEREAWAAWERSQKPTQEARVKDADPRKAMKTMKSRHGDLRCLEILLKCSASRRALLGLDLAPPALELHNHAHLHEGDSLDERRQRLLEIVDQFRQRAGSLDAGAAAGGEQSDDVRADRQPGEMAAGPTLGLPGPGAPGSDH